MSHPEPWPLLDEEVIFEGHRRLVKKTYRCPDGSEFAYELFDSPHVVCTAAVTPENRFIMVEQFRPGPNQHILEFPAGGLEPDEDPPVAAARELLEETGYEGEMEFLHQSHFSAYSNRIRFNFLARNCQKVAEPEPEPGEFITIKTLSAQEFFNYIVDGGSTDVEAGYAALYRLGFLQRGAFK